MTKRDVCIALVGAIVLGILLGVIIGWAGGFFKKNERLERLANNNKISAQKKAEEEKAKEKKEGEKTKDEKASEAADEAKAKADEAKNETTAEKEKEEKAAQGKGTIQTGNGQNLNVRSAADPASGILTSVADGTAVEILETQNGMTHIRVGTTEGWVVSTYVAPAA